MYSEQKVHFVASEAEAAQTALGSMINRYGQNDPENAEVVVALGGDGFMLRTLHRLLPANLPVYGMKIGNVLFKGKFRLKIIDLVIKGIDLLSGFIHNFYPG